MSRLIKHLQYDKELPDFEELSEDNFIWIPLTSMMTATLRGVP